MSDAEQPSEPAGDVSSAELHMAFIALVGASLSWGAYLLFFGMQVRAQVAEDPSFYDHANVLLGGGAAYLLSGILFLLKPTRRVGLIAVGVAGLLFLAALAIFGMLAQSPVALGVCAGLFGLVYVNRGAGKSG